MSQVDINVTVKPKGASITDGVAFEFSGTPSSVVSSDGSIDLSKQYPSGTAVALAFTLTNHTLVFSKGPSVGTFDMSFFGAANGAKDACWIAPNGQNPGIYNGTEFVFGSNSLGPGFASLTITDNNGDGLTYAYALWIWVATDGTSGQRFEDDPHIINHHVSK